MFERKIKKDFLKLAQIVYGGEFYNQLENYKIKDIKCSKFPKYVDSLLSKQGIDKFYAYKNEETGFVGNVFDNGKYLVIAYRGTERLGLGENISDLGAFIKDVFVDINLMTQNFDLQFKDAWDFYKEVKKENPKRKIIIVGQSLGGALAQIVAAKEFTVNRIKVETYTFNAPGCSHLLEIYDCSQKPDYSFITNYSVMNDWCGMFGEHIGKRYLLKPIEIGAIREDAPVEEIINNVLLTTHEGIFNYTEQTMGKVIRKPSNFNQKEGLSLWYFSKNNPLSKYPSFADFINTNFPQFNMIQSDIQDNSFLQKAQQFLTNNIPEEVQNSPVAVAIKNATDSFVEASNEQMAKFAESINKNAISCAIDVLNFAFSELSADSFEKAKNILKREYKMNI